MATSHQLVLLARDPKKLKDLAERGATIKPGSLDDHAYVSDATRGADVLFLVIPPDFASSDFRAFQNRVGDAAVSAITANKITRVVFLSSVGAHHGDGYGPVSGLSDVEKALRKTPAHVTMLRPTFFMENFLANLPTIAASGAMFMPVPGSVRVPFVATSDVAKLAAQRIQDARWTGTSVMELVGPEDVSFDEAAQAIGGAVGKKVAHMECTADQLIDALVAIGISKNVASSYAQLYQRFREGRFDPETKPRRGEMTFKTFAKVVFAPAYQGMAR
jgi:uncharacterized protein YbjT (DUF2867 family)